MHRIKLRQKVVALILDDGPTEHTPTILKYLRDTGVKATFFLVGDQIETQPALARAIVANGHQVGNHTYSHKRMLLKRLKFVESEVLRTNALIRDIGFTDEIVFRPPHGRKLFMLPWYLKRIRTKLVMWSVNPDPYPYITQNPETVAMRAQNQVRPGSIILLHPMNNDVDRSAIPLLIKRLKGAGYRFVTVNQLLALEQAERAGLSRVLSSQSK